MFIIIFEIFYFFNNIINYFLNINNLNKIENILLFFIYNRLKIHPLILLNIVKISILQLLPLFKFFKNFFNGGIYKIIFTNL